MYKYTLANAQFDTGKMLKSVGGLAILKVLSVQPLTGDTFWGGDLMKHPLNISPLTN